MAAPTIFSRRLRSCFLLRAAPRGLLPLLPPLPVAGRAPAGRPPEGRPPAGRPAVPPLRDAVVRARPSRPPPPPPVLRARAGAGRRTDPARGATGEVSSWDGTREPLSDCRGSATGTAPVAALRLQLWERGRTRGAPVPGSAPAVPALHAEACTPGAGDYSVATRRRLLRGWRPGSGSTPSTYEKPRWFQPQLRHTSTAYTVNSSCMASIRASSASVLA